MSRPARPEALDAGPGGDGAGLAGAAVADGFSVLGRRGHGRDEPAGSRLRRLGPRAVVQPGGAGGLAVDRGGELAAAGPGRAGASAGAAAGRLRRGRLGGATGAGHARPPGGPAGRGCAGRVVFPRALQRRGQAVQHGPADVGGPVERGLGAAVPSGRAPAVGGMAGAGRSRRVGVVPVGVRRGRGGAGAGLGRAARAALGRVGGDGSRGGAAGGQPGRHAAPVSAGGVHAAGHAGPLGRGIPADGQAVPAAVVAAEGSHGADDGLSDGRPQRRERPDVRVRGGGGGEPVASAARGGARPAGSAAGADAGGGGPAPVPLRDAQSDFAAHGAGVLSAGGGRRGGDPAAGLPRAAAARGGVGGLGLPAGRRGGGGHRARRGLALQDARRPRHPRRPDAPGRAVGAGGGPMADLRPAVTGQSRPAPCALAPRADLRAGGPPPAPRAGVSGAMAQPRAAGARANVADRVARRVGGAV